MPIAWFISKITRREKRVMLVYRKAVIFDYVAEIEQSIDGGKVVLTEVLGSFAIAKVKASSAVLDSIASNPNIQRLPKTLLTESLSDLTNAQKTAIVSKLQEMGYTTTEIRNRLGNNIGNKTFGDVLRFATTRRLKPRYDEASDTIFVDGPEQPVAPIEWVDGEVN
jgi:hypothetical protein